MTLTCDILYDSRMQGVHNLLKHEAKVWLLCQGCDFVETEVFLLRNPNHLRLDVVGYIDNKPALAVECGDIYIPDLQRVHHFGGLGDVKLFHLPFYAFTMTFKSIGLLEPPHPFGDCSQCEYNREALDW